MAADAFSHASGRTANSGGVMGRLGHAAWLAFMSPVLAAQAAYVRMATPRLPDAAGPAEGELPGRGPALRLLVIGESTVAGVGAQRMEETLACQCAGRLRGMTGKAVRWKALGRSGANARKLLACVRASRLEADLVILALGVNDTVALRPAATWALDLEALISAVRESVGNVPVLLAGVPPMERFTALPWPLRGCLGRRARALDREARRLAARLKGVRHCPTPLPEPEHLAADGFHPSQAGYKGWAWLLAHEMAVLAGLGPDELVAELAAVSYNPLTWATIGRHEAA